MEKVFSGSEDSKAVSQQGFPVASQMEYEQQRLG